MSLTRHALALSSAPARLAGLMLACALVAALGAADVQPPSGGALAASSFTGATEGEASDATRAAIATSTTTVATSAAVAAPDVRSLPQTATTSSDLPVAALNAYERAEQVIDSVRPGCHLSWGVLAAIGQVESDHGRAGGGDLGIDGTSSTPVRGAVLDGSHGSARVVDTDGGQLDGSTAWDRAVGPMQFLPSTWITARVDGDGDGVRSADDIDDASLASAVFLCAWDEDLSTANGAAKAIGHYNHTRGYAAGVLALARTYDAASYLTYAWSDALSATWSGPSLLASAPPATTTGLDAASRPRTTATAGAQPPAATQPAGSATTSPQTSAAPTPSVTPSPSSSPSATPTAAPSATPTPSASDSPSEPAATATPDPAPTTPTPDPTPSPAEGGTGQADLSGTLLACGDAQFCVADQVLDLGLLDGPATADFDKDGTTATRLAELTGLLGTPVTVTLDKAKVVTEVDGLTW